MSGKQTRLILVIFWVVAGGLYTFGAVRQRISLNLSATAGGQYPYLVYAQGIAQKGAAQFVGDRNRMPLYPFLLATVHHESWDVFVGRAVWLSIFLSMTVLLGIGVLAYVILPRWHATALTLTAVFGLCADKAAFVQAEFLFYGLFFLSWWLAVGLIERGGLLRAAAAGVALGLCYLTKASALPLIAMLTLFMILRAAVNMHHALRAEDATPGGNAPSWEKPVIATVALLICFSATVSPYVNENKDRFGKYFYNVNSEFFMWCDSWQEAKTFADANQVDEHYPDLPAEQIPSPSNYLRTHTARQCLGRLSYGLGSLGGMLIRSSYGRYLLATLILLAAVAAPNLQRLKDAVKPHVFVLVFGLVTLAGYLMAYAWYVQVAYGDRFLRSMILPVMWGLLWCLSRLGRAAPRHRRTLAVPGPQNTDTGYARTENGRSEEAGSQGASLGTAPAIVLVALILVDGGWRAVASAHKPTPEFIRFYYNESKERQMAGDLVESSRGFAGVIELDPRFAPAYLSLGINQLVTGRAEEAVDTLIKAVDLAPDHADAYNSLGSALCQAGRAGEAIPFFQHALALKPDFAIARFNLGGAYCEIGKFPEAEKVREQLRSIDIELGTQLAELIERYASSAQNP